MSDEIEVTFSITHKELREKWSERCSVEEWIEMFENVSKNYDVWDGDFQIAEYLIQRLRTKCSITDHLDDVPEVLRPLVIEALKDEFLEKKAEDENVTLDQVSSEQELEAIIRLRDYDSLSYEDGITLFCEGYEFAQSNESKSLSDYSMEELLDEIKRRY